MLKIKLLLVQEVYDYENKLWNNISVAAMDNVEYWENSSATDVR